MDDYKALVEELHLLREPFSYSKTLGARAANALESQRSRIEALEAVISEVERTVMVDGERSAYERIWAIEDLLEAASSTVLDQMDGFTYENVPGGWLVCDVCGVRVSEELKHQAWHEEQERR
jgi:hypothetical protein